MKLNEITKKAFKTTLKDPNAGIMLQKMEQIKDATPDWTFTYKRKGNSKKYLLVKAMPSDNLIAQFQERGDKYEEDIVFALIDLFHETFPPNKGYIMGSGTTSTEWAEMFKIYEPV